MKFDWDENKNTTNHRKHGIWFEEAQTVWTDESSSEFLDPKHEEEDRFIRVRFSARSRLLLVVFCERSDSTVIRIISARKATSKEKKQHEEGI
jgi:uncharacterized DUF497 family protein